MADSPRTGHDLVVQKFLDQEGQVNWGRCPATKEQ